MSGSFSITLNCTILDHMTLSNFAFRLSRNFRKTLISRYCRILGKIYRTLEINYVIKIQNCYMAKVCFKCLLYCWFPLTWCVYIYMFQYLCCYCIILLCSWHKKIHQNAITLPNKFNCTTAMDFQHLKVKEKDICLTKNYCTTIGIQKINSFHKFIFKIQQILGSHELKGHGHFWPCQSTKHWTNF